MRKTQRERWAFSKFTYCFNAIEWSETQLYVLKCFIGFVLRTLEGFQQIWGLDKNLGAAGEAPQRLKPPFFVWQQKCQG
jgi:hypothetical protein